MTLITRYEDFLERVDELGFMAFSNILEGFPSLMAETPVGIWHTGRDTDPWCWKDRAAEEKRLAFGCLLGGHKGFVSARMYGLFHTAFHPGESMASRWASGLVSRTTWELWQLFGDKPSLSTGDIRRETGVTKKNGSKVDAAIRELQRYFYITVSGSCRKVDRFGQPYGWPANIYEKVTDWVPEDWMEDSGSVRPDDAREMILDEGTVIGKNIKRDKLAGILGIRL